MDLTLAICTYRRPELLQAALASLAACARPQGLAWELVVVDNAAESAVADIVQDGTRRFPQVRYVAEPVLGTSHARNRAVAEARGPVVLFTDDDVRFDPQWLVAMARAIQGHPECTFWGGRVEPLWPEGVTAPVWFDPAQCPLLGDTIVQYRCGTTPRSWSPQTDLPFFTANLALRVDAVKQAGGFDPSVGHRGAVRMGMEDSLLVEALAGAGGLGWYAADAVVYHPVPAERLTKVYARQFVRRQAWMSIAFLLRRGKLQRPPRWLYRAAAQGMLGGAVRWVGGAVTLNPAQRFAGELHLRYNAARLYEAARWHRP